MRIRKLSIIVPVFNEEKTVGEVIKRLSDLVIKGIKKEVIIVDDGSVDGTTESLRKQSKSKSKDFKFIFKNKNEGKGAAIKTGLKYATGDYVIVQDADLEYHPREIKKLVRLAEKTGTSVIYGTRNRGISNRYAYPVLYWGAKPLIWMINILYCQNLSDPECCYKLIRRDLLDFEIEEKGFGMEVELTAKLAKKKIKILEVPIAYIPRTYTQGKKITVIDGVRAVWLAIKWAI